MSLLQSVALGLLQGMTEFLPVSSSGHLVVAQRLMGLGEVPLAFDVLLHVPTLLAILIVFRERLIAVIASLGRWMKGARDAEVLAHVRLLSAMAIATAVTAAVGLAISHLVEEDSLPTKTIGALFLLTALLLAASRWFGGNRDYSRIGWREGLLVGLGQGIGVLPGVSRSGITLVAALASGLRREQAGEFAFLLAVPAVLGASVLELPRAGSLPIAPGALAAGLLAAFAAGLGSLVLLLRVIRRGRLYLFALYLAPLGMAVLLLA